MTENKEEDNKSPLIENKNKEEEDIKSPLIENKSKEEEDIKKISMSNKTERIYTLVLKNILDILESFNIDINSITKYMMSDFEKSLRNSIKNLFPHQSLMDVISIIPNFYGIRQIWLGLFKKKLIKKLKMFLFLLKLCSYIQ